MRVCVRPTPAQGRFLLFLSLLVSLRALQQALLRLCPSPLVPTMAAGLEHGMSKLLRMMHKKDKSSQDQARQQFKVEPFTSGQANAPASSSRPFNPTASAPAAFISERSRTPPGMVTTIGHGKSGWAVAGVGVDGFPRVHAAPVSDSRRAGTPPYSHRARTPPANHPSHSRSHAHSQSQSLANHSALAGVGAYTLTAQPLDAHADT